MKSPTRRLPICPAAILFAACLVTLISTRLPAQTLDDFSVSFDLYGMDHFVVQPDGRILLNGYYANGRVFPDGSTDPNFTLVRPAGGGRVDAFLIQPDYKLVAGGQFLERFSSSGIFESSFASGSSYTVPFALQPDAKIIAGTWDLRRYNTNGTVDNTFTTPALNGGILEIALQADGKVVIGGFFSAVQGQTRHGITRLTAAGALDTSFSTGQGLAGSTTRSILMQPDGKILVAGQYVTSGNPQTGSITALNLRRLNSDGTIDSSFAAATNGVGVIALQADGKILVGGPFTTATGQTRTNLGRLNADGSLDESFTEAVFTQVSTNSSFNFQGPIQQADGKLLFAVTDATHTRLLRLNNTEPATGSLNFDGSIITWQRGGTAPEVWRTTFDFSTNHGATWAPVGNGAGSRFQGVWRRTTGGTVPTNANIRARGYYHSSGFGARSRTFLESFLGPLFIVRQPESQTDDAVTVARLDVAALGDGPLTYQWLKNGVPLTNGGNLSGALSPSLILTDVLAIDAGGYSVVVGDSTGSVTSRVATLTVRDPRFISQNLYNTFVLPGSNFTFSVEAVGTPPLTYQWRQGNVNLTNGGGISGAQSPTLIVANAYGTNGGNYSVVVSSFSGSVTSSTATVYVSDPYVFGAPASQWVAPGQTLELTATVDGTAPLRFQWYKDGTRVSGATNLTLAISNAQYADSGRYSLTISNRFGGTETYPVVAGVTAALPDEFTPPSYGAVSGLAVQSDGRILAGGNFSYFTGDTYRYGLGRFFPDGTLDAGFNPYQDDQTRVIVLQADGKILQGGSFSFTPNPGQFRAGLRRLNPNGTLDRTFSPGFDEAFGTTVNAIAPLPDGNFIVGGLFDLVVSPPYSSLAKLGPNGSLDSAFRPEFDGEVFSVALQADGKILVGGAFNTVNGVSRPYLARLLPSGVTDATFGATANDVVRCLALQPDGKILIGGNFTRLSGNARVAVGRLNTNGSVDATFQGSLGFPDVGESPVVHSIALQADGKMIVGGRFLTVGGLPSQLIARLHTNGAPDNTFLQGAEGYVVSAVGIQRNGRVLVGGEFNFPFVPSAYGFARLNNTEAPSESLSYDGASITWQRGGTAPEVSSVRFDFSTNGGGTWQDLGAGQRITTGWSLPAPSSLSNATLRARGVVTGGAGNGSAWHARMLIGPLSVELQPASRTNDAATAASFFVAASGTEPIVYQWFKDNQPLADGGNIAGAATASLRVTNVFGADAGGYQVVISNSLGAVTSQMATLTVVDPLIVGITTTPTVPVIPLGGAIELSVAAVGSAPLTYQWTRNGAPLLGATSSLLKIPNAQARDAGEYSVIVGNAFGVRSAIPIDVGVTAAFPDEFNGTNGSPISFPPERMALQADGKIIVSPSIRLLPDGTQDNLMDWAPQAGGTVQSISVLADGNVLLGGNLSIYPTSGSANLARLRPDGTLDAGFTNQFFADSVEGIAVQPDGKVIAGGWKYNGTAFKPYVARFNSNGTRDTSFNPLIQALDYSSIRAVVLQPNGSILVGGQFSLVGGRPRTNLARLNPNGTVDTNFVAGTDSPGSIFSLALQPDGKILVAGSFESLAGQPRKNFGRLNADGSFDATFKPITDDAPPFYALALQADGRVFASAESSLWRFHPNGTRDRTFDVYASGWIADLALQPDGRLLLCGSFQMINGLPRLHLGRLNATDPAIDHLSILGPTVAWMRGGTAPEIWRAEFEISADGTTWTSLGQGTRIEGGWQLDGIPPLEGVVLRARGFVASSGHGGWFVQSTISDSFQILARSFRNHPTSFRFAGPAGQTIVIEGSDDLQNWIPLATNAIAWDGLLRFTDTNSGQFQHRFYRGRID